MESYSGFRVTNQKMHFLLKFCILHCYLHMIINRNGALDSSDFLLKIVFPYLVLFTTQTHVPCSINWQKDLRIEDKKSVVHEIGWKSHAAQRRLHPFIDMFDKIICSNAVMVSNRNNATTIWCLTYMMRNRNGSIPKRFPDIFSSTFTWRVVQGRRWEISDSMQSDYIVWKIIINKCCAHCIHCNILTIKRYLCPIRT